jgi:hypothetical protein
MKADWKKIVREAERQGWAVEPATKGLKLVPPDRTKQIVYVHGTPSDQRAIKNKLAEMRRQGFQWPPRR